MGQSIVSKFFTFATLRLSDYFGVKLHSIPWRVFYFIGFNEVAVIFASNHSKRSTLVFQVESLFFSLTEIKNRAMTSARIPDFFLLSINDEIRCRNKRS